MCMTGVMYVKNKAKILDTNSKISTKVLIVVTAMSMGNLLYVLIRNLIND